MGIWTYEEGSVDGAEFRRHLERERGRTGSGEGRVEVVVGKVDD